MQTVQQFGYVGCTVHDKQAVNFEQHTRKQTLHNAATLSRPTTLFSHNDNDSQAAAYGFETEPPKNQLHQILQVPRLKLQN